jgi:hypothetical protein
VKVVDSDASAAMTAKAKAISDALSKTVGREVACEKIIELMNA